jgi:hypothetical protein
MKVSITIRLRYAASILSLVPLEPLGYLLFSSAARIKTAYFFSSLEATFTNVFES